MDTDSDSKIRKAIAYNERMLAKVRVGSWTAEKIQETLDYYRRQLSLPRSKRTQYTKGTL